MSRHSRSGGSGGQAPIESLHDPVAAAGFKARCLQIGPSERDRRRGDHHRTSGGEVGANRRPGRPAPGVARSLGGEVSPTARTLADMDPPKLSHLFSPPKVVPIEHIVPELAAVAGDPSTVGRPT